MFDKKLIFNFISNSYSQFLDSNGTPVFQQQTIQREAHPDLEFFRQPEANSWHLLYLKRKSLARVHQLIFWSLSLVFLGLATLVYFKTTNWVCSVYFDDCGFVKTCVYSSCLFFSLITFCLGYFSKPEKEAAHQMSYRMEKALRNLYKRQQQEMKWLFAYNEDKKLKKVVFQQSYHQALENMKEAKEEIIQVLERIAHSQCPNRIKDRLFNQAIMELQDKLADAFQLFKQKSYPLIEVESTKSLIKSA